MQFARRLLVPIFWTALLFALVMALLPQPPRLPGAPSDKIQHIMAFLVLTALSVVAYRRARLLKIGALLALFGAGIELLQLIPPLHREGSFTDWLADAGAVLLVLLLATGLRRLRPGEMIAHSGAQ